MIKTIKLKKTCGQKGAKSYRLHDAENREARKKTYISRHSNGDHSKSNINSPAFMSRWLLWNNPTLNKSIT